MGEHVVQHAHGVGEVALVLAGDVVAAEAVVHQRQRHPLQHVRRAQRQSDGEVHVLADAKVLAEAADGPQGARARQDHAHAVDRRAYPRFDELGLAASERQVDGVARADPAVVAIDERAPRIGRELGHHPLEEQRMPGVVAVQKGDERRLHGLQRRVGRRAGPAVDGAPDDVHRRPEALGHGLGRAVVGGVVDHQDAVGRTRLIENRGHRAHRPLRAVVAAHHHGDRRIRPVDCRFEGRGRGSVSGSGHGRPVADEGAGGGALCGRAVRRPERGGAG